MSSREIPPRKDKSEKRFLATLICLACLSLISCIFYCFIQPQTPVRMTRASASLMEQLPLWSWAASLSVPVPRSGTAIAICLILFAVLSFATYGIAVYVVRHRQGRPASLFTVVAAAVVFFAISALAMPNHTTDLYHYITEARMVAVHDANPYYTLANQFPDDPIYQYASRQYTRQPTLQLPTLMLINTTMARVSGDNPVTTLLAYRFMLLAFNVANLVMVAIILAVWKPRYLLAGVIFYGWNPVVAIYGQSKPDTVMVFFLLLAALALVTARKRSAAVCLALSVFAKLITLPLVAVYWLGEFRLKRWRSLVVTSLLLAATAMAIHYPFAETPALAFRNVALVRTGGSWLPHGVRLAVMAAFALVILAVGFRQDGSYQKLFNGWGATMVFFALFLTKMPNAWYLMALIAVVSLALDRRLVAITIALSFAGFLFGTWYSTSSLALPLPDLFAMPKLLVYLAVPCLVAACMIVVLSWQRRQDHVGLSRRMETATEKFHATEPHYGEDMLS